MDKTIEQVMDEAKRVQASSDSQQPTDDVYVYAHGLCCLSACSSLGVEELTKRLNRDWPTGIESRWRLSKEAFKDGTPNPCPCHDHPNVRKHYLFDC